MVLSCTRCGSVIPVPHRADARFCGSACKQAAYRARHRPLPAELTERARWVRWELQERRGRSTKVPLTIFGGPASATDSRTWTTYVKAKDSAVGDGLGIVLGDGLGCIDLDDCLDGERITLWAHEVLAEHRGHALLIERSQSGRGIHIFLPLPEAPGHRIRDGRNIETYSRGRFIAVTGDRL